MNKPIKCKNCNRIIINPRKYQVNCSKKCTNESTLKYRKAYLIKYRKKHKIKKGGIK
jgi:uncharacterized OB-fold protein